MSRKSDSGARKEVRRIGCLGFGGETADREERSAEAHGAPTVLAVPAGEGEVTGEANLLRGDKVILSCLTAGAPTLRRCSGERSLDSALVDVFFGADSPAWLSRELQRRPDAEC